MALSLAAAPVIEADKHGAGAMAIEADHLAHHAGHGYSHDMPSGHHDAGDHDPVSAALLTSPAATFHAQPTRALRPDGIIADGTIREGPRRPPRLMI